MKNLFLKYLMSCLLLVSGMQVVSAQKFPKVPNPAKLVNDLTGQVLSPSTIAGLESTLVAFDNKTSNQVAVVILNSTEGYEVTEYATGLGREWGIGNKQNNGVLLLVAYKDRKVSIVPGYGLEGVMPDAVCKTIIDAEIIPSFKRNNYEEGILKGVDAIMKATQDAYTAPDGYANRGNKKGGSGAGVFFIILIFVLIILFSSRGGGGGRGGTADRRGYHDIPPIIFFPGGGGGRSSGGGFGGGGFGGFGGGSFGGGGASGSW
ncbi:TPM domain-containing protein [Polluticaenibacter yanchengensis]|uniref:TPM domain-containing protein n=1 Tax=Polluticaenibacter yanchengensis TaxID=3014562 RepID=A0ABT4UIC4_9BACT|nr:TPM domain-containing protein [Chitinophagaceae bacterium LY-5]